MDEILSLIDEMKQHAGLHSCEWITLNNVEIAIRNKAQQKLKIASVSGKRLVQLLDKELETKGIPHYEDENTQGYCAGLLKAIELIQAACASSAAGTVAVGEPTWRDECASAGEDCGCGAICMFAPSVRKSSEGQP